MKVICPYTALELQIALIGAANKFEIYEKEHGQDAMEKKMLEAMPGMPKCETRAEYNKIVADFHGVSVDTLVNSPNYEKMQNEYQASIIDKAIAFLEKSFGFTNKEAWAIVAHEEVASS